MISQFELKRTEISEYQFISFSIDYSRLDEYLSVVADKLKKLHYKGKILFDLAISNGIADDRFYEAYFNGSDFDLHSFYRQKNIPYSVLEISNNFYANNIHFLDNSVLTKPQKFLFKKEIMKNYKLT